MHDSASPGRALVRRPGPRLAEGIVTHLERLPVDFDRALSQWERYVSVLADSGWEIIEVPPDDDSPDAVFVEDTVVMYQDLAVLCRPGAESRRPELGGTAATLDELGYQVEPITGAGTLDGGDVLKVRSGSGATKTRPDTQADTVYVGLSGRTNEAGIEQLTRLLEPRGATVIPVPISKVLHLKSAVTALPDGSVIGYEPLVDDRERFAAFVAVPEEPGAHVVLLGGKRLLMAAGAPRTMELLSARGYEPVPVEIDEFEKLEGCVTCLSVRLRANP
ncbi:MAG: dimethylargininase [Acidimicrobiales bacterium]